MNKEDSNSETKPQDVFTLDTPADLPPKDPNAENQEPKKIIRVVTVMAYLFSVSFVGVLLSAYYIFLWEPSNPKLIQRERLRTDPQMQFLIVPPSEETDLTKKDSSFLLQSEVNHKPLLGRMAQNIYDSDDSIVNLRDKINLEKKQRLNAMLLKLRHSLVLRAQNRNSSQEAAISNGFNDSFMEVEKVSNLTMGPAENTISRSGKSRGNISEEKTHSDKADLPPEFADSVSTMNVGSTSATSKFMTIPGTETSQSHFDGDSVTDANPTSIIEEKNWYHKKKLNTVGSYFIRGFSNARINSNITNNRRVFGNKDSSKMIQEFPKIDTFDDRKEAMKENGTNGHRLVNNDRVNDSDDVKTSVIPKERVNNSVRNSQENYFSYNESSSNNQIGRIARDRVSIDSLPRNSGFPDVSGFHQTLDNPTVIKLQRTTGTRNFEGERIRADLPAFLTALG